jgi:biopolymer transport protein ExbD
MTPMIDVTFLLLIFFLCTLRFRSLEGKLAAYMPRQHGPVAEPSVHVEPLLVRIDVAEPGDPARAGGGPLRSLRYRVGPLETRSLAEVEARLAYQRAADPDRPVTLAPGEGVLHGEVVRVLDAALSAGIEGVTFAGSSGS